MVTRDSNRTRSNILTAATQAFVASGPAGARVDAIAAAAGVNKRMLYHHFGDKRGLYQAVLADSADKVGPVSEERARLLAWEGLSQSRERQGQNASDHEDKEEAKEEAKDEARQEAKHKVGLGSEVSLSSGIAPIQEPEQEPKQEPIEKLGAQGGLDAQMFALLQTALQVFPYVCGPEVKRLTGLAAGSEAFDAALGRLREQVEQQLGPKARVQGPKAKVTLRARSAPRV